MTRASVEKFNYSSPITLVNTIGGRYSKDLGIGLASCGSQEVFKWFLAAVLFGARISGTIAVRTYREFIREGLNTPRALARRGWHGLVAVLDRSGYARYDFKTATKLLEAVGSLQQNYRGDLNALHETAETPEDLERRIKALAKGIGDVTANIFLREMRGIWPKADPLPSEVVLAASKSQNFIPADMTDRRQALDLLKSVWASAGKPPQDFPDFEAALLRLGLRERPKRSRPRPSGQTKAA